jgi:hypothetical protein
LRQQSVNAYGYRSIYLSAEADHLADVKYTRAAGCSVTRSIPPEKIRKKRSERANGVKKEKDTIIISSIAVCIQRRRRRGIKYSFSDRLGPIVSSADMYKGTRLIIIQHLGVPAFSLFLVFPN